MARAKAETILGGYGVNGSGGILRGERPPSGVLINGLMKESFTTQDVATILGITRVTVRNWVLKGHLKADTTKGGHRRISRGELERFLASRGVPLSLIREYELTKHKRFLFCWEYYNLGFFDEASLDRKDCHNCLVYKSRAQKCHLVRGRMPCGPKTGPGAICAPNCSTCGYFNKYMAAVATKHEG